MVLNRNKRVFDAGKSQKGYSVTKTLRGIESERGQGALCPLRGSMRGQRPLTNSPLTNSPLNSHRSPGSPSLAWVNMHQHGRHSQAQCLGYEV